MADFGPFRPLKPYVEADRSLFFGRERELALLQEKLQGDRPSALLYGEAGIGKTSLVRAGLLPGLKSRGVSCAYADSANLDEAPVPQGGAAGALLVVDDVGAAIDEGPRWDKLLLLLQRSAQVKNLKILFIVDDADLWRLEALEKRIGHVGSGGQKLRLERFDQARLADVIERTVLGGGAYFEAGLSHEMAADLAKSGPVSPAQLQLVAAAAVALRLNTIRAYRRSGGADVITWRYFERACARAGGAAAARGLAEIAAREPRAVVGRDEVARAAGVDDAAAEKLLGILQSEHVVKRIGDGWTIGHEFARPIARAYTGEARGRGVAARLLLRRKIDGGGLLSLGQVREVKRYAGTLAPDEEKILRRSVQAGVLVTAVLLAVPVAATVVLYGSHARSYYLDAGPAPGAPVVARLGRPASALHALPHSPRFGSVVADSGFARAALAGGLPDGAGPRSGPEDDRWLRRLMGALKRLPQGAVALILDGDLKPLQAAYEDAAMRPAVVGAIGAAGRGAAGEAALLKRALGDASEDVRRRAVQAAAALERRAAGSTVAVLAGALKDASPSVRALALQEIRALPDAQAAPLLAQALAEADDPLLRRAALDAIGEQVKRTPAAAAALGQAMLGPARADAVAILARLVDGEGPAADAAADAVAKVALDAKAPEEARLDALRILRRRPTTPEGLDGIAGSAKLQAAVMPLLVRTSPEEAQAKVAEAMRGPAPLRAAAAAAIGLLPRTADTPRQLKVLQYDSSSEVHAEAVRALPVLGREALPLLIKESKGQGAEVERAAVETLALHAAKLGVGSVAAALEGAVRGGRQSTRRAAIEALGRLAEQKPAVASAALGRLLHEKAADVRADAAGALGDVLAQGGKEAITALRQVARDPDPAARRRAAGAFGRADETLAPLAAKALSAFAADSDAQVRLEAATALGQLGAAARESGSLGALLADKDASVRAAARKAVQAGGAGPGAGELDKVLLQTFAGAAPGERSDIAVTAGRVGAAQTVRAALADADPAVRRAAAEHAGSLGAATVPGLLAALNDVDTAVRVAAVRGLAAAKAAQALAQAARSSDREVRAEALEAIGEVATAGQGGVGGAGPARAVLEAALSDASERVRVAAVQGLAPLGRESAELLERALSDPARDVRAAAVVSLGRVWAALPAQELASRLRDEADADRRYAAALALARQAQRPTAGDAVKLLAEVGEKGTPAARLTARIAHAFLGRPDDLAAFMRLLRDGN